MKQITALYIDLFCGAGGTSSGVEYAKLDGRKCAEVVACVNHDTNAIRSHKANHPHTLHFIEDIRTLELSPMVKHLDKKRRQFPKAKVVLWASLECTNFSKAKGGQPCIWYECDSNMPLVSLDIYCFGTGFRMDDLPPMTYIGTVNQDDDFIWHFYRA